MSTAQGGEHECEQLQDAASYVLCALEDLEAQAFAEHLTTCESCREEVAKLQPVANTLAVGVARATPPHSLRARIMAPVHAEAELLRAAGHEADRVVPARRGVRSVVRRGLLPALAATLALGAGLLVGALAINGGSSVKLEVIRASVVAPGHRATAVLRKSGTHLELVVLGMPAPPPGNIYEVWLERGTQAPEPTDALFSVTRSGSGAVGVPGYVKGVSQVLVTAEPLGGTLKPTRTPVIVAKI
jgi:hypothetical protein